ncbi:hypothetical protein O6H91_09G023800 [Diphasiastrum complanatum]|uniref:Uncharacterized protein n=1 Tax=Diphasiastrum complanatum TaxID=34168 RepID=A0ACC2CMA1_DIPCM|nr:hypothetical protein O6H91_09G023800 [Diphasiastrum complanatum]
MHSYALRVNTAVTLAIMVLAVLCSFVSLSDHFHASSPHVHLEVLSIDAFQRQKAGNDEVWLTLNISADFSSVFSWNTKQLFIFVAAEYVTPKNVVNQVSLWDAILVSKNHAKFSIKTRNKYSFVDQGNNLRGSDFNLTMYWHVMPLTGAMYTEKQVFSGFRLPTE